MLYGGESGRLQNGGSSEGDVGVAYSRCSSLGRKGCFGRKPQRGVAFWKPLWQQGLDVEEVYRSRDDLNQHHSSGVFSTIAR